MQDILTHLTNRRSVPAANLVEPAPSEAELETIFSIGTRVPDHGKLAPWRFVLFKGNARIEAGRKLLELLKSRNEPLDAEQENQELNRLARAPLVVGVVSKAAKHPKIPVWEQKLSAGAVCMNLLHAIHALGYAGQWLSEWYTFDEEAGRIFGLTENERFAGFIHIGTADVTPTERPRPEIGPLITNWGD